MWISGSRDDLAAELYIECAREAETSGGVVMAAPIGFAQHVVSRLADERDRAEAFNILGRRLYMRSDDGISDPDALLQGVVASFRRYPRMLGHADFMASLAEVVKFENVGREVLDLVEPFRYPQANIEYLLLCGAIGGFESRQFAELVEAGQYDLTGVSIGSFLSRAMNAQSVPLAIQEKVMINLFDAEWRSRASISRLFAWCELDAIHAQCRSGMATEETCVELDLPLIVARLARP